MRLGHLLGRGRGHDVTAGGEHLGVGGVPEVAPDDQPLEVLAHGPRVLRDERRAHDGLEPAVAEGLCPPVEREGGGGAREGDAVAGEVDRPGAETVGAPVAEHGQGSRRRRVGDPEREGRLRRVVPVRLESVGGNVREVLAGPGRHEAPVGPAQQGLGKVGVVAPALRPVGDAEGDPALVAGRHRHELDVRVLADGVTAGRGCGAAGAELVPLVRAAVPDVDAKAPGDVLGR